jgi:hypothetical protein
MKMDPRERRGGGTANVPSCCRHSLLNFWEASWVIPAIFGQSLMDGFFHRNWVRPSTTMSQKNVAPTALNLKCNTYNKEIYGKKRSAVLLTTPSPPWCGLLTHPASLGPDERSDAVHTQTRTHKHKQHACTRTLYPRMHTSMHTRTHCAAYAGISSNIRVAW